MSAASSPPPTTSTPSSRPSPRAPSASSACRCCARARSPCPGSLPRVIRVLIHYYAPDEHDARARLPRRGPSALRADLAPRSSRHNRAMAIEFAERIRRIPVYPAAGGYALEEPVVLLASNESPYPPLPEVARRSTAALRGLNRYPDPTSARAARARSPTATTCPARGSRSATARATSCSPPARRCSSRAPSSSTRGRRSRSTRSWPPPRARARSTVAARRRATATTSTRCCARSRSPRAW